MRLTDPQKFTSVSAIVIVAVMAATGIAASRFYRQVLIERESAVMHDLVRSFIREEQAEGDFSTSDLEHYTDPAASQRLAKSFGELRQLPGFDQVKVFNRDMTIVWSNATELIGSRQTHHPDAVAAAIANNMATAFNPSRSDSGGNTLIEFYIPFRLEAEADSVTGVISLYRAAAPIDAAIRRGALLLWLVTGVGGIVLYLALYRLFLAVHRDRGQITSRFAKLRSEHARLIQLEKLSAMGQMVAEIAHQLNNPLVGVINLTELAAREAGDPVRLKQLLGDVRSAGERCRDYVERVLRLAQLDTSDRKPTDLGHLARETVAFFQQSLGGLPRIDVETPAEPVICDVDAELVRNALFNLVHNATQADLEGPVTLTIAPERRKGAPGCSVSVSDNGPGIAPEAAEQLFTPFFTTRPGGTGLGLSIAQHVALSHGGTIDAENRPGGGARFTIWIPATGASA